MPVRVGSSEGLGVFGLEKALQFFSDAKHLVRIALWVDQGSVPRLEQLRICL
jgi:hypothetical protein